MGKSPFAPTPDPAHSKFIDDIGGPARVAEYISFVTRFDERPMVMQSVSMWKKRGIPFRYRHLLVRRAKKLGVEVPPNFLDDGLRCG